MSGAACPGRCLSRDVTAWLARLAVAIVFIWASVYKIWDPAAFARSIYNYQILPGNLINATAILMPWLELLCGMALLAAPAMRRGAALWILGLLVVFTIAIASAMLRGIDISCGCFSATPQEGDHVSWFNLVRNACLIGLCLVCLRREEATPSASAGSASSSPSAAR